MASLKILSRIEIEHDPSLGQALRNKFGLLEQGTSSKAGRRFALILKRSEKALPKDGVRLGKDHSRSAGSLCVHDRSGAVLRIQNHILSEKVEIDVDLGFDSLKLLSVLEDVVFCKSIQSGVLPVHSGAMRFKGKGFLFPAWGGSGKTRMLLQALAVEKAVVSDEWNFIAEGRVHPYSDHIVLMHYDLLAFPRLATGLELLRAKLFTCVRPGFASSLLQELGLILRSKRVPVSSLSASEQAPFPLDRVYLVERAGVPSARLETCDPDHLVRFLVGNFFREKPSLFALLNWSGLCSPGPENAVVALIQEYAVLAKTSFPSPCAKIVLPLNGSANSLEMLDDTTPFQHP